MKDSIRFAGYSRLASGAMKFRTATNIARVRQLEKFGDEVYMIQIAPVSTKSAAAKELVRLDHARGVADLEQFYSAQVRDENPFKKSATVSGIAVFSILSSAFKGRFCASDFSLLRCAELALQNG